MHPELQAAFEQAMAEARHHVFQGELAAAQAALERAHVLGQAHVWPHVVTHAGMLRLAWRRRQWGAVGGQAVRLLLGALGSAVGILPTGNTGGSDVGMFRRMPVDPALQRLIAGGASHSAGEPGSRA